MSTMTKRAILRNATKAALEVHPSARPRPDIVGPDQLVEVDDTDGVVSSLTASGFKRVDKRAHADELDEQLAAAAAVVRPAEPEPEPEPAQEPATEQPVVETGEPTTEDDNTKGEGQ